VIAWTYGGVPSRAASPTIEPRGPFLTPRRGLALAAVCEVLLNLVSVEPPPRG
jgi:hypothetical protein